MTNRTTQDDVGFWKKTHPIPTWLAVLVALITLFSISLNIYFKVVELPTNIVSIGEGPTADPHYNLSQTYVGKVKLNFDGRYATYYVEWKIQDEIGKSAGFQQVEKCDKLGFLTEEESTEEINCKIKFDNYDNYKITVNVYYIVDEIGIPGSEEKIQYLLDKGERSYPWAYLVHVKES